MSASRRPALGDLASLRWAMEPAVHPTEPRVALVISGPSESVDGIAYELSVFDVGSEQARVVLPAARAPTWSPDGQNLGYLRLTAGRWVPAVRGVDGHDWDLPSPPGNTVAIEWNPQHQGLLAITSHQKSSPKRHLPYFANESRHWKPADFGRVWSLDRGESPLELGLDLSDVVAADWSPDGKRFAVVAGHGVNRDRSLAHGLWTIDTDSGEADCLVAPQVPLHGVSWSPDNLKIAYLASERDNANSAPIGLWVLDVTTRSRKRLGAQLDRSIGKTVRGDDERGIGPPILEWSAASDSVIAIYADGGRSRLASFAVDGGVTEIELDDRCVLEFSRGGAGIAYSWSDPQTPGEVSFLDTSTGHTTAITDLRAGLSSVEWSPTERVEVTASDGVQVEGWVTMPPGAGPVPLVLQVHGGPHYPVGERFSFDAQRLAARGIAVLRANPRGSVGYGRDFAAGNLGDWGGRDFADLLELVDETIRSFPVDPDRIAVIGESYGGYMAAWSVTRGSRFLAAVVENGISDLFSSAGGAIGPTFWHSEMGGAPWEIPARYQQRSPMTHLGQVDATVLVIHCEEDQTCSITQGEALHAGLSELGRDVQFLRVPDEGHFFNVFGALSRRLERTRQLDRFLIDQLQPVVSDQARPKEESSA